MPLHRVFRPTGFFSAEDKKAIFQRLTPVYTSVGLPAFYVVVIFIDVDEDSFFRGGEPTSKFVRIVSSHLARHTVDEDDRANAMQVPGNVFAPYVKDRGMNWGLHVEEHERELWRENGQVPPMPHTAGEKTWGEAQQGGPLLDA